MLLSFDNNIIFLTRSKSNDLCLIEDGKDRAAAGRSQCSISTLPRNDDEILIYLVHPPVTITWMPSINHGGMNVEPSTFSLAHNKSDLWYSEESDTYDGDGLLVDNSVAQYPIYCYYFFHNILPCVAGSSNHSINELHIPVIYFS